jgi:hypothetical protein
MVVEFSVNVSTDLRHQESSPQGCIASIIEIVGQHVIEQRPPSSLVAFPVLRVNTSLHFRLLVVREAFHEDVSLGRSS